MKSPGIILRRIALALALTTVLSPTPTGAKENSTPCQNASKEAVVSTQKQANGHRWVKARILIKATPHVVWESVHEERKRDPDLEYSKVLHQKDNQATLEQKFALIPIIGTATCVMKHVEVPYQRIDYNMISSDRFKAFEGSWVLTPAEDPNSTYLELATYCDMGLPVPRSMIEGITAKKVQRRLANVKIMAEATQTRIAQGEELN